MSWIQVSLMLWRFTGVPEPLIGLMRFRVRDTRARVMASQASVTVTKFPCLKVTLIGAWDSKYIVSQRFQKRVRVVDGLI